MCVCQDILIEVPRLQHIIVVDDTPTSWPGYPRGITVHNMAAVQKLGAKPENGKNVFVCVTLVFILSKQSDFRRAFNVSW